MLKINNFTKMYSKNVKVVNNLTLHIEKGDIFGFIGHNGAGKTTTIKSVVGILDFEEGEILINGKSIKKHPIECKKEIAFIPDNPDIYPFMTGIKYLNFIADIFDIDSELREQRIKKYADAFEITSDLGSPIASYSHGMKQKLAIISALIHEPKLLILDEPFVGLDPKASHTLKEYMKEMCSKGSAIFFSTHVLEVAEKLCNKVAIIKKGSLMATGSMEKVKGDSSLEEIFLELIENE
ncbi:ABC transporter ATP-binding protein [Sedimentibacter sp. zth1]|uniref:ABC transporter ATP-binding protein n=1 Tax=Sedimentibacter sp. zth1 TaxID=2816908 RepID=UPI001A911196|nr:ABC transporter ATP-binding protein [Sedimentibacter sp. zth1]QSX06075.1 ABC transporter ATP-binding protein [Sedimentibacter sp. zth1]